MGIYVEKTTRLPSTFQSILEVHIFIAIIFFFSCYLYACPKSNIQRETSLKKIIFILLN